MSTSAIPLKISAPTGVTSPGRGFYQLEEETLFIQIGLFSDRHRFFSFIEAGHTRFDVDRTGCLLFIELDLSRRHWSVSPALIPPREIQSADIRFLLFREDIPPPKIITNPAKTYLKLDFLPPALPRYYYLGDHVIATVNENDCLSSIWVTSITDDLAGQEILAFRKQFRPTASYFA